MPLQFKHQTGKPPAVNPALLKQQRSYQPVKSNIPGLNIGLPYGLNVGQTYVAPRIQHIPAPPIELPGANLPHAVNYYADYGGCGAWRMVWPEHFLNMYQKAIVNGLSTMILEPRFYGNVKAVKLQRQATPVQHQFVKFLQLAAKEYGFKIIYEIDDIVFKEDIPDYNRCKDAFNDPTIVQSILAMMQAVDEISVTCDYMRDYYINKTGNKNVTVIPNYPPKAWIDRYYNKETIRENFVDNLKQPRVGWLVSGTHFDVANRTNLNDDGSHVYKQMIKTRKKFKWVFFGAFPLQVKPFVDNGEMEYKPWSVLYDYPAAITELKLNAVIAPLVDNVFNKSKSNIKYLESGALGIPGIFQDLPTYKDAPLRFTTGDEMIAQLETLLHNFDTYLKQSNAARKYVETMWLENENNLMKHYELYFTPFGSEKRKFLKETNP